MPVWNRSILSRGAGVRAFVRDQSPRTTPVVALLLYQRAAPSWNGRIVLRVKFAGTVSAAAGWICIISSWIVEDRLEDCIDEIVGQIGARDREIVHADGLIMAPQRRVGAGRDGRRREFRQRQAQCDHLARRQGQIADVALLLKLGDLRNRDARDHRQRIELARLSCAARSVQLPVTKLASILSALNNSGM